MEETAKLCDEIEAAIRKKIPAKELDGILDNIGLPYSGINLSYSNSGVIGTSDADIMVSLKPGHKPTADYQRQLRIDLPHEFPGTLFTFQPADIVSQILNFGLPAPIDIQFVGSKVAQNLDLARKVAEQLSHVPGAVDVNVHQTYDGPHFQINMDRSQSEQVGITASNIAQSVLVSLSGSFQTSPTFFLDPKKRRQLQRRDPGAAVQHQLHPGSGEPAGAWHHLLADPREPRLDQPRFRTGGDLSLRYPAPSSTSSPTSRTATSVPSPAT